MDNEINTTTEPTVSADAPVNTSVAEPSTAPALQNDAPGTTETPPTQQPAEQQNAAQTDAAASPPQQDTTAQQGNLGQQAQLFYNLAENDIFKIVDAVRPVIADEINKAMPQLQAQAGAIVNAVQGEVNAQLRGQHGEILDAIEKKIEQLLHPQQPPQQ